MDWRGTLWSAYNSTVNAAVDLTADAFKTAGSLACLVGGAGLAIADAMNVTFSATYYGAADVNGVVNLNIYIPKYNYTYKEQIPFDHTENRTGGFGKNLYDFLTPQGVRQVSVILAGTGFAMRFVGENLKYWQTNRAEYAYCKDKYSIELRRPDFTEYGAVNLASALGSFTYILSSNFAVGCVMNYSGWLGTVSGLTYPEHSNTTINGTYYNGPVAQLTLPVTYSLAKNSTLNLPIVGDLQIDEQVNLNGKVNATYGAGIFAKSESTPDYPIAIPGLIAMTAYLSSRFFNSRAEGQHKERLKEAINSGYSLA